MLSLKVVNDASTFCGDIKRSLKPLVCASYLTPPASMKLDADERTEWIKAEAESLLEAGDYLQGPRDDKVCASDL
jgi:hypothetical protein